MPNNINENINVNENSFPHNSLYTNPISSLDTFSIDNNHSLSLNSHSSLNPDCDLTAISVRTPNYNNDSGYGLVNAGAAVARVANHNTIPDVPDLSGRNNWGVNLIKAPSAWSQGYTGEGVIIAVLDTGVDYNHRDLNDNIWTNTGEISGNGIDDDGNGYIDDLQGWNFTDDNNNIRDINGHGTHVAGTIAAENNGFGITGIAHNAKIMPVKVLNDKGSGNTRSLARGIYYAVNNGAKVINLSLGSNSPNSTLEAAIEYASKQGAVVVMAAGNSSYLAPGYPAQYANKWGLAVGAVDSNNQMADFSNKAGINPLSYVTAPGVSIYSTVTKGKYAKYSGTSMATPHVAGVVALMLNANPNLTDAEIRQMIIETAGNSTPIATSSFFNIGPVVSQAIAETVYNSTSTTAINFELPASNWPFTSLIFPQNSSLNPGTQTQFRYDHRDYRIFNSDDIDKNNQYFTNIELTDIEKILNQLQQQIEDFKRFFPSF